MYANLLYDIIFKSFPNKELPRESNVIFLVDTSDNLLGSDLRSVKQYLKAVLPKYNRNSRISLLNTGNDIVEILLSPQGKLKETSTIIQQVDAFTHLQGVESLRKALNHVLSNKEKFNINTLGGGELMKKKTEFVILTNGINSDSSSLSDNGSLMKTLRDDLNAVFTFVVLRDDYGTTEKSLRPVLGADDVIIKVPGSKMLPGFVDEIHSNVVNGLAGMNSIHFCLFVFCRMHIIFQKFLNKIQETFGLILRCKP